ncbi:MAG: heme ABC transporter ATP-binding protein [Leptothrix sp. (in: Bacteria)]|nr:heme ABC transporter ATP-binding protein [Leptothrix sp. (in: b-proteobacteria)]
MSLTAEDLRLVKSQRTLLDIPRLSLAAGRLHALLGPNGAGKSTLLGALAGLEHSVLRQVRLLGQPLSHWDTLDLARARALLPQDNPVPFDFNVRDIVHMGRYPHRDQPHPREAQLVDDALQMAGALHLVHQRYELLSGGEKARVHLARVLAQVWAHPDHPMERWLLLDEPTAALDLAHQHTVMRLLRELTRQGVGVIAVLHDINLAGAYADQVLVMSQGRIDTMGDCEQVLQPSLVERVWGVVCESLPRRDQAGRGWLAFS